jgi:hypothetical protein
MISFPPPPLQKFPPKTRSPSTPVLPPTALASASAPLSPSTRSSPHHHCSRKPFLFPLFLPQPRFLPPPAPCVLSSPHHHRRRRPPPLSSIISGQNPLPLERQPVFGEHHYEAPFLFLAHLLSQSSFWVISISCFLFLCFYIIF